MEALKKCDVSNHEMWHDVRDVNTKLTGTTWHATGYEERRQLPQVLQKTAAYGTGEENISVTCYHLMQHQHRAAQQADNALGYDTPMPSMDNECHLRKAMMRLGWTEDSYANLHSKHPEECDDLLQYAKYALTFMRRDRHDDHYHYNKNSRNGVVIIILNDHCTMVLYN